MEKDGSLTLCEPANSLLATRVAGPLEAEIRSAFDDWKTALEAFPADIETIAASSDSNLVVMPSPIKPTILRRLPAGLSTGCSA